MALRVMEIGLALALLTTMLFGHASAQTGCTTALLGLMPCLGYITGNTSTPSSSCCSQLATVVQSQPRCLCLVLNGAVGSNLGITINNTQALELPNACNVKTPPASQCNASSPAASPTATPTPSTPSTPSTPKTPSTPSNLAPETPSTPSSPSTPSVLPSGGGSKTTPSTNAQSSDGRSMKFTQSLIASLLLTAASVSVFVF